MFIQVSTFQKHGMITKSPELTDLLVSLFPTLRCSRYKTPTSNWQAECFCVPLLLPRWHPGEAGCFGFHSTTPAVDSVPLHVTVAVLAAHLQENAWKKLAISTIPILQLGYTDTNLSMKKWSTPGCHSGLAHQDASCEKRSRHRPVQVSKLLSNLFDEHELAYCMFVIKQIIQTTMHTTVRVSNNLPTL